MKKRVLSIFLVIALMLSAAGLSSCALGDYLMTTGSLENDAPGKSSSDPVTQKDLNEAIAEAMRNLSVNSGDTYEVIVNSEAGTDALAAAKALLSVVSVVASFEVPQYSYDYWRGTSRQTGTETTRQAGAGVIYQMDKDLGNAYIITNYHVIYNAAGQPTVSESLKLYLYGQEMESYAIPATVVGGSMTYDIAVLKVENSAVLRQSGALVATVADSDDVSVLETAIAIGNPEGSGISATLGHVNVDSEYITMTAADGRTSVEMRLMRIDTAVNGGNSGGGLFNNKGELMGIVNAKLQDSAIDNIGYAIPSNIATAVADNILHYGDGNMYRCLLSIQVRTASSSSVFDTETGKVHIREVVAVDEIKTANAISSQLAVDDVIKSIKIGDKTYTVNRLYNVVDAMLHAKVGDTVVVNYERAGAAGSTEAVTLDESFKTAVQ